MERDEGLSARLKDEGRYRLLIEAITDYAIYILDREGRVASWNAGAARMKGYVAEEIIGQHFSRFYAEEDRRAGVPATGLATAAEAGRWENEGWRVRKDGSRFWAQAVIDAIRDEAGEVIGFAKVTRDMTERREAQQALEQAREALFQSQKLDAIGQLTGGIAHDFNNLLMAVLGSLELVRKRLPYDPKVTPLIENALQGARRGAGLTQRLLTFARKQTLSTEAIDLASLVRGMTELLQRSLGPTIWIETRFPRDLPKTRSDANQLETALLNLAVNARDAMPEGGAIRIEAEACAVGPDSAVGLPPGDYVRLSFADTGQGMDADTLSHATEPFFTTKGIGKGTGLGLSMVHGLAEQSGGRMTIASRPGEGTVVELWLPKAEEEAERQVFAGQLRAAAVADVEPMVILTVDDDNLVLMNTIAMLEDLGHTAFAASSARDALATLRREEVDLVITDYAMPQTTGVQLAEAIRARVQPAPPMILATGFADLPAVAASDLPQLAKPFTQEDLAEAIRLVSEERRVKSAQDVPAA